MTLDLFKNLANEIKESNLVQNFINELSNYIEKNSKLKLAENKYSDYWDYQNFMEDNVAATIGISRWATVVTYSDELRESIDESILELSKREGTLYRKQFMANGSENGMVYNIEKFENGKIERIRIPYDQIPSIYKDEDIIFQYKKDGSIQIRMDLKDEVVKMTSEKCEKLKIKENEKAEDFKREGHIYEAFEDDGYIFLNDLTEERDFSIEDIDFVVDCYQGDGTYQVIDGEYRKIEEQNIN